MLQYIANMCLYNNWCTYEILVTNNLAFLYLHNSVQNHVLSTWRNVLYCPVCCIVSSPVTEPTHQPEVMVFYDAKISLFRIFSLCCVCVCARALNLIHNFFPDTHRVHESLAWLASKPLVNPFSLDPNLCLHFCPLLHGNYFSPNKFRRNAKSHAFLPGVAPPPPHSCRN